MGISSIWGSYFFPFHFLCNSFLEMKKCIRVYLICLQVRPDIVCVDISLCSYDGSHNVKLRLFLFLPIIILFILFSFLYLHHNNHSRRQNLLLQKLY